MPDLSSRDEITVILPSPRTGLRITVEKLDDTPTVVVITSPTK